MFFVLFVGAENIAIPIRSQASSGSLSPSVLVIVAAVAANGAHGTLLAGALTGCGGGLVLTSFRRKRYRSAVINGALYLLAGAAAGAAYRLAAPSHSRFVMLQAMAAAVVFIAVNLSLVMPAIAFDSGASVRSIWTQLRPTVPNDLTFGLLGTLMGQVYNWLGPIALVLLVVPLVIARWSFSSFIEIQEARETTIGVFLRAIHAKDAYTGEHTLRVARYSAYIGEELGLSAERQQHLRQSALMHDIGKLAVPRHLLNKPGKLTNEEFRSVQRHAHVCVDILSEVDFLRPMIAAAAGHHSRYDGGGYGGTSDADMEAFIVSVADAFDAMTSTRAYRKALDQDVAFAELRDKSGSQFHPDCVEALVSAIERRGERYGLGHEETAVEFDVVPPTVGVGSAGLGDLADRSEPQPVRIAVRGHATPSDRTPAGAT